VLTAEGGVELRTISLPIRLSPEHGGRVDPVIRKEVLHLAAAQARDEAVRAREAGDYDRARETLSAAASTLASSAYTDPDVLEEIEDLRVMERRIQTRALDAGDVKRMKQRSYDTHRSRSGSRGRGQREDRDSGSPRPGREPNG
jgi:hypothetical protein